MSDTKKETPSSIMEAFEKVCDALMSLDADEAARVLRAAAVLCGLEHELKDKGP